MKSIKVLSIIGIVWFVLAFFCQAGFQYSDPSAAIGWGVLAEIYGIAFAITALVQANNALK
jgi:hypothetical protein